MPKLSGGTVATVAVVGILVASAFASAAQQPSEAARYKLQNGDTVDLNFVFVPEFNQTVTLQPDGYLTLRAVGDLPAAGLTIPQLKKAIEAKYVDVLKDPVVSIELKDFEKPYFLAQGKVQKPGKYDLRSEVTLSQAVAIAGGLSGDAKHSQVLLFRPHPGDEMEVKEIDLKRVLKGQDLESDINIKAGDMVVVPQNRISKIKPFVPLPFLRVMFPGF